MKRKNQDNWCILFEGPKIDGHVVNPTDILDFESDNTDHYTEWLELKKVYVLQVSDC